MPIFAGMNAPATTLQTPFSLLDIHQLADKLPVLREAYMSARPYPHIHIDGFLDENLARQAREAFPEVRDAGWIHYVHVNERKHGLNKMDLLPPFIRELIRELNQPAFVALLSELTGIPGLLADDSLEGGGLHQSQRGGFLNVHADFTVHPHRRTWQRRVNLLIYLNEDWQPEYGGDLELWERDMSRCTTKIAPLFNRAVIFNTDADSYHGFPEPIQCPEGVTRKSIALYYFTEEPTPPVMRSTNYRARPGDGLKAVLIWMDKRLVGLYTRVKGALGINDDAVSRVLGWFSRKPKG